MLLWIRMAKLIERLMIFIAALFFIDCQDIKWTWIDGSQGSNILQSANNPGGRSGMAYWSYDGYLQYPDYCLGTETLEHDLQVECAKLSQLSVMMFGGEYHVDQSSNKVKNDLWMYTEHTHTWKMVHNGTGDSEDSVPAPRQLTASCGVKGSYFVVYGGLDVDEHVLGDTWIYYISDNEWYKLQDFRDKIGASNQTGGDQPAARGDMVVWCTSKEMIIFGGYDEDFGLRHDMWIFDLATLSWHESKISSDLPADSDFVKHLDYPDGRSGSTSWVSGDRLFMLGGNILPKSPRSKHLMIGYSGDLWDFDLKERMWTYHKGSRQPCTKAGIYGKLGTASRENEPGCRRRAAAWVDSRKNLWMFGGDGIDDSQESISVFKHSRLLSDLWFFDLHTDKWTWKGGEKSGEQKGSYGDKGDGSHDNLPGSRCEMAVWGVWNYLYLFGGVGHDANGKDGYLNDVWTLDVHLDESVFKNSPYPGLVFGIIILGCGLIVLMTILYLLGGKNVRKNEEETKGKYQQIPEDVEA
ncbi:hypothetical protein ACF0H5_003537 [Mactra antiquata]